MKAVIFAGGSGTRLWPLSRKKSPKQFEKLIGDKSTVQLAVERLLPDFKYEDIYISTNLIYKKIIHEQMSYIPQKNLIFEPEKKDVGPAIALIMGIFSKTIPREPIVILWSDHLVKRAGFFRKILKKAGNFIEKDPNKIIFIGHKPRYASTNLGYIHFNQKSLYFESLDFFGFEGLKYKPDEATAKNFIQQGNYAWNLGYFVTSPAFIYQQFAKLAPNIYKNTEKIISHYGKKDFETVLRKNYGQVENINFDNAILENLDKRDAFVIVEDIGWSDIGAWEALKESLETHQYENVIRGKVHLDHVRDCLIYNYEDKKLIVAIDLDENIIVNTNDVLLVTKKTSISKLSRLLKTFEGTENEKLI
jgi:mannose-1-phosphate guanylyltransferase